MKTILRVQTTGSIPVKVTGRMRNLPKMTRIGVRAWGNKLQQSMIRSMKGAGIEPFTGELFRDTKWVQGQNSNYGQLVVPIHGVMLDNMVIHRLWFRRDYGMRLRWAQQARNDQVRVWGGEVRRGQKEKFFLWVRPHPWIQSGYRDARKKLPAVLKEYAGRAVKAQ